jgi:hypothetical protein
VTCLPVVFVEVNDKVWENLDFHRTSPRFSLDDLKLSQIFCSIKLSNNSQNNDSYETLRKVLFGVLGGSGKLRGRRRENRSQRNAKTGKSWKTFWAPVGGRFKTAVKFNRYQHDSVTLKAT